MIDDDLDPVEEIRTIRRNIMKKYKTLDAYFEHIHTLPSPQEMHDQIKAKLAKSNKIKSHPVSRRRKQTVKV